MMTTLSARQDIHTSRSDALVNMLLAAFIDSSSFGTMVVAILTLSVLLIQMLSSEVCTAQPTLKACIMLIQYVHDDTRTQLAHTLYVSRSGQVANGTIRAPLSCQDQSGQIVLSNQF